MNMTVIPEDNRVEVSNAKAGVSSGADLVTSSSFRLPAVEEVKTFIF